MDFSKLKSKLFGVFNKKGEEEEEEPVASPVKAAAAGDRVDHRDAVTPDLVAHLQALAADDTTAAATATAASPPS